uniref:ATP-binding cassette domain-containing protein n=1 Tax=Sphingomonas bacterium TaxID=1895847 RepID=UPI0034444006
MSRNSSFHLESGDGVSARFEFQTDARVLVIQGGTGTGKTTLARAICGAESREGRRVTGVISLGGVSFPLSVRPLQSCRIGYVPQESVGAFLTTKVLDDVLAVAFALRRPPSEALHVVRAWVESSPLGELGSRSPLSLSGGERRLLSIELALLAEPDHLVLDGGANALSADRCLYVAGLLETWLFSNPGRCLIVTGQDAHTIIRSNFKRYNVDLGVGDVTSARNLNYSGLSAAAAGKNGVTLELCNVSGGKGENGDVIIRNASFRVKKEEICGISGPNGAGKTTLLRLITGLYDLRRGSILFEAKSIFHSAWPGEKNGIAYLPQEMDLAGPSIITSSAGAGGSGIISTLEYWCKILSLNWDGSIEAFWSMSSGERAKACLAAQAIHTPRLWLLDEPTLRLTTSVLSEFLRVVIAESSIVVVSHDTDMLNAISTLRLHVEDGQVTRVGDGPESSSANM